MSRRRRVVFVCVVGLVAGAIAHFVDPDGRAAALCFLAAGLVLGELLVLRLEDGSALPLSYAVLVVLASSFALRASSRSRCSAPSWSRSCCAITDRDRTVAARRSSSSASRSRPRRSPRITPRGTLVGQREDGRARCSPRSRPRRSRRSSSTSRVRKVLAARRVVLAARPARVAGDRVVGHADGDRLPRRRRRRARRHLGSAALLHAAARGLVRVRAARLRDAFVPPDDRGARDGARARRAWCRPATRNASRRSRRRWASSSACPATTCATSRWPRCCTTSAR